MIDLDNLSFKTHDDSIRSYTKILLKQYLERESNECRFIPRYSKDLNELLENTIKSIESRPRSEIDSETKEVIIAHMEANKEVDYEIYFINGGEQNLVDHPPARMTVEVIEFLKGSTDKSKIMVNYNKNLYEIPIDINEETFYDNTKANKLILGKPKKLEAALS